MTPQKDLFAEIAALRAWGEPAAMATVIATRGSAPARSAMSMVVLADGRTLGTVGGGALEEGIRRLGLEAIATEECRRETFEIANEAADDSEMICGGAVEVFVQPLTVPTCHLIGAGHLASAVAPVAAVAGFRVVVHDDRKTHAVASRFPDAAAVRSAPFDDLLAALAKELNGASYCVVVTRSHRMDERAALACLRGPARYVGMIGSSNKVRTCHAYLASEGLPAARIADLRAPVGLDVGARTHGEIAVSIVAEMVRVRRGGGTGSKGIAPAPAATSAGPAARSGGRRGPSRPAGR